MKSGGKKNLPNTEI